MARLSGRAALPIRGILIALVFSLSACSRLTFMHDQMTSVSIDGRNIVLSWVEMEDDQYDVVAWAEDKQRLDAKTARQAAQSFISSRCGLVWSADDFSEEKPRPTFVDGRHAFRYRCT
jgi:hypothetical protein